MMAIEIQRVLLVSLLLVTYSSSFGVLKPTTPRRLPTTTDTNRRQIALYLAEESSNVGGNEEPSAATASEEEAETPEVVVQDDEVEEVPVAEADGPNEKEPVEDPEVIALKAEIGALEAELKILRNSLSHTQDTADEYTKTGYARKVAEMENVRRSRKMIQSSNKSAATAGLVAQFLPILDRLIELRDTYADDEFGKQYGALPSALQSAFIQLDVTEYFVTVGDRIDDTRMIVTESVHSEAAPAGTVVEAIMPGLELQGNIVRPAMCIASLGPEPAAADDDAGSEDAPESGEEPSEA